MRLGIDLDGVLFPFDENFRDYCVKVGLDVEPDAKAECWDFFKEWGITTEQFIELCNQGVDDGFIFLEADPYPYSVAVLEALYEEGHSVHIITHRMFGSKSAHNTFDWLFRHKVPFTSVTFAEDKTFAQMDVLLDDRIENYESSWVAGIPSLLFDRPWNAEHPTPFRIRDWEQFYYVVQLMVDYGVEDYFS